MAGIPSTVGEIYRAMKTEVIWLHATWTIYEDIYLYSETRVRLLNACAPVAFRLIQDSMKNDILLSIARLMDVPETRKKQQHLSIGQLHRRIGEVRDATLSRNLHPLVKDLRKACQPIIQHRNEMLAHLDLQAALEKEAQSLSPVPKVNLERALAALRAYMNAIGTHYDESPFGYENFGTAQRDSQRLIHTLISGLRYADLEDDDVVPYDDLAKSMWWDA